MNVQLLTFHCALNYGAVLQAYALGKVMADLGHEVVLVDLRPPALTEGFSLHPRGLMKRYEFSHFVKRFCPRLIAKTIHPGQLRARLKPADACVVGSDQVWNPEITGLFATDYFLDFVPPDCRKIAYAASFGCEKPEWGERLKGQVANHLASFAAISVRERSGKRVLSELGVRHAAHVLDPTLLLGEFKELLSAEAKPRPELLCLVFEPREAFRAAAIAMAERLSLTPVVLARHRPDRDFQAVPHPGVREWVQRFHDASFVITDSFHGLACALIFNKPFVVVPGNRERFCRLKDLLVDLGLESRIFENYGELLNDLRWTEAIPYEQVNALLAVKREESLRFLRAGLSPFSHGNERIRQ
jgi:hypothetical protein